MGETHHKSGESTWLDPSINVVQDTPGLLFDLDIVDDILPTEDGSLTLDDTCIGLSCSVVAALSDIFSLDSSVGSFAILGIALVLVLELLGDPASLEDQDLSL
jgi:hypothetical protein